MIYIFDGNESLLIQQEINKIIAASKADTFNIQRYEGSDKYFSLESFIDDCNTIPFFSEKKVMVLRNPPFLLKKAKKEENKEEENNKEKTKSNKEKKEEMITNLFLSYCENPAYETELILYIEDGKFTKSTNFNKIVKNAKYISFESSKDFMNEAFFKINEYKLNMSQSARNLLISYANNSLSSLIQNLDKLALYPDEIDNEVIIKLCDKSIDTLIFNLTNAIFAKDLKNSLEVLENFESLSISVFYLIASIASQLRFYYELQYYDKCGYNTRKIMQLTDTKSEYRIRVSFDTIRRYNNINFLKLLTSLAEVDQSLKSNNDLDPYRKFELFIINLIGGRYASN